MAAMFLNDPGHARAIRTYRDMAAAGTVAAICMPLLLMECWNVFRRLADDHTGSQLVAIVQGARMSATGQGVLFTDPTPRSAVERRSYALESTERLVELWLAPLRVARIRLTYTLLEQSRNNMASWGLKSHDAIWLAVAEAVATAVARPPAIATVDGDFGRVHGLDIWGLRE
jgi:hypothetical protein